MKSMTGYGKIFHDFTLGTLEIEIKSVNHRYQSFSYRSFPKFMDAYEFPVINRLKDKIQRGSVTITVKYTPNEHTSLVDLSVDHELAVKYHQELTKLKENLHLSGDIYPASFLSCQHVFSCRERDLPEMNDYIFEAIDLALAQYDAFRTREADNLRQQIEECTDRIQLIVQKLSLEKESMTDSYILNLKEKMNRFAEKYGEIPHERILQEALLYADKSDVSEEITRLSCHTEELRKTLYQDGSIGKKLDFISQECLRESNTIGSKANTTAISMIAIDLKCEIEKIREQVQNIE